MTPPDFARWQRWVMPLVDTLAMSVAGTALAVLFSLPLALLAAPNTTPNRLIYQVSRLLLSALRSVPEIIMGVLFVAADAVRFRPVEVIGADEMATTPD
jgi:phosphonate transport system permease protein